MLLEGYKLHVIGDEDMRYEGMVYRPPSEAYSLIIQVTIGCSHNKCTFCSMFKEKRFNIRKVDEIIEDLEMARSHYKTVRRVFLADGDALILKMQDLEKILIKIKELFPECERVSAYATAQDILRKSEIDLKRLRNLGLKILYLGVESGSDEVLKDVKKGSTVSDMVQAGKRAKTAGIKISATIIIGLGGKEKWEINAIETAKLINEIDPEYLGLLTLTVDQGTEMYEKVQRGEIRELEPIEVMMEIRKFVEELKVTDCVLRSNHVCNYVPLAATLNKDKQALLKQLDTIIEGDYELHRKIYGI